MKEIKVIPGEDPLELLRRCDGYYERKPGGPLVGYAGKDKRGRQYVGDVYVNFAKAESRGIVLLNIAEMLRYRIQPFNYNAGFCAAPEGGKALGVALSLLTGNRYIFPEKETTALKNDKEREKSELVWKRHEPEPGEGYWIVEDVCNNFSTTETIIELIKSRQAHVVGIICFLNRSLKFKNFFTDSKKSMHPIRALVTKPIPEYEQDDPKVIADVQAGNVVFKPKDEWDKLVPA